MDYSNSRISSSIGVKSTLIRTLDGMDFSNLSIANSELKQMEVSLKSYVKDIFDRIDLNQQSHNMQISNIRNLASKMSIQFSQFGAGNPKPRYESSIGVEIEKMNVETLALGSRNYDFDHELEKVEVAYKVFDDMPKQNFGVVYKVNEEMPHGNVSPTWANHVEASVCILNRLQPSPEYGLHCFIGGLKEEIQSMVRLFEPQTIREAYYLAKIHELTLVLEEAENSEEVEELVLKDVKEHKDKFRQVISELMQKVGILDHRSMEITHPCGRNTLQMMCHRSCSQDVSLEDVKDNHEPKYASVEDNVGI
ncbi:hypothetical protein Tco_0827694 [Tanacetum coccineum]